jgi:hypothetical protein
MPTRTSPAASSGEGVRNKWSIAFLRASSPIIQPRSLKECSGRTARMATEGSGRPLEGFRTLVGDPPRSPQDVDKRHFAGW